MWSKLEKKLSGTSYEDLLTFHCFWRHEIAIKAFSSSEMVSGLKKAEEVQTLR